MNNFRRESGEEIRGLATVLELLCRLFMAIAGKEGRRGAHFRENLKGRCLELGTSDHAMGAVACMELFKNNRLGKGKDEIRAW